MENANLDTVNVIDLEIFANLEKSPPFPKSFLAKTLGKSLFHGQSACSSYGLAGQI